MATSYRMGSMEVNTQPLLPPLLRSMEVALLGVPYRSVVWRDLAALLLAQGSPTNLKRGVDAEIHLKSLKSWNSSWYLLWYIRVSWAVFSNEERKK